MKRGNYRPYNKNKKPRYYDNFNEELAQYGLLTQYGSTPLKANNKPKAVADIRTDMENKDICLPEDDDDDDFIPPEPIPYAHASPAPPAIANMTTPVPFDRLHGYSNGRPLNNPCPPPAPVPPVAPFHAGVAAANANIPPASTLNSSPNRSIYLGNVTEELSAHDILQCVHQGALEQFRIHKERYCAFLTFLDAKAANAFFQAYTTKKFVVKGIVLGVNWALPKAISPALQIQLDAGATRNVYLGRLEETDTVESITLKLKKFGPIEHIRLIRAQNIAFVHFLSILSAIKCNSTLRLEPDWRGKYVGYGRDHCTDVFTQYNSALGVSPQKLLRNSRDLPYEPMDEDPIENNLTNIKRTVYFGNIHSEATPEDLCNVIKGGNVLKIQFFKATQNAFVTFFDEESAERVYQHFERYQVTIRGRKLKLGWGKLSSISPRTAFAIKNGASRNLYIGGIDPAIYTVDKLRKDFSDYGELEQVNVLKDNNTAFVNFLSLNDAMTALVAIKTKPDYADIKVSYGKDRCGNKPKITKAMEIKANKRLEKLSRKGNPMQVDDQKDEDKKEESKKEEAKKDEGKKEECKKDEGKKEETKRKKLRKMKTKRKKLSKMKARRVQCE
ncbi:hypothetical protein BD560DRAFT_51516 [Blakeslea trispora]|nr:hypothetical protein BD560DRAFT_51516 [Blakeslea trispora]